MYVPCLLSPAEIRPSVCTSPTDSAPQLNPELSNKMQISQTLARFQDWYCTHSTCARRLLDTVIFFLPTINTLMEIINALEVYGVHGGVVRVDIKKKKRKKKLELTSAFDN